MIRKSFPLVVVLVLLAASVVMARAAATIAPVQSPTQTATDIQVVRGYYAALNQFMQTGDAADLEPFIKAGRAAWEPITPSGLSMLPTLLAMRSSYPGLRFSVDEINVTGEVVAVQGQAVTAGSRTPPWLGGQTQPARWPITDQFRVVDGQIVEHWPAGPAATSFFDLVPPGAEFRVNAPSIMVAARLTITHPGAGKKYATIPGPGIVVVERGAIAITGNGLLEAVDPGHGPAMEIPPGAVYVARAGTAIVIPLGNLVVQVTGDTETSLLLATVVPANAEPVQSQQRKGGEQVGLTLEDTLRQADPAARPIWFGTVQVLAQDPAELAPGWIQMEIGWMATPPGESVSLDHTRCSMVLWPLGPDIDIAGSEAPNAIELHNTSDAQRLVFVARARPVS